MVCKGEGVVTYRRDVELKNFGFLAGVSNNNNKLANNFILSRRRGE